MSEFNWDQFPAAAEGDGEFNWDQFPAAKDYNTPEARALEAEATLAADKKYEYDNAPGRGTANFLQAMSAGVQDMAPFQGVSDRISAGMGAAYDQATGSDKSFGESYNEDFKGIRDRRKADMEKSRAGRLTGQAVGLGENLIIPSGGGYAPNMVMGGLEGFTRGDELSPSGALFGTLFAGAATAGGNMLGAAPGYVKDAYSAAKASNGATDAAQNVIMSGVRRFHNAGDMQKLRSKAVKSMISQMTEDGGSKEGLRSAQNMMDKMSDEELITKGIWEGNDEVMQWASQRAASLHPGQVQAEDVYNVLKQGHEARVNARNFVDNKKAIAKDISGLVDETGTKIDDAVRDRVSNLSSEASRKFDISEAENIEDAIIGAYRDAHSLKSIPGDVKKSIEDAHQIWIEGGGLSKWNLSKGAPADVHNFDQFQRLQKIRETLDLGIDWEGIKAGNRMTRGEEILVGLRDNIDSVLKTAPGKTQSDSVFQLGQKIYDEVFKKTEFKGGVDEFKLARLFNNTDDAGRFRNSLDQLKAWADDPQYAPEARAAAQKFVDKFQALYKMADDAKAIGRLRMRNGPSSPAVEAFQSFQGKGSTVNDLTQATSGYINQTDEWMKRIPSITGKAYKDMTEAEKNAVIKLRLWEDQAAKAGRIAGEDTLRDNYKIFLKKNGVKP